MDDTLVCLIQDAAGKAFRQLFQEHDETFYYCSLITTGEGLCPVLTAWSWEALERAAGAAGDVAQARYDLKWSYGESPYFAYGQAYFQEVNGVFLERMRGLTAEEDIQREVCLRVQAMEQAMGRLDQEGLFGRGEKRLGMVVLVEFMPPDSTNTERAFRLNPKEALRQWLEEAAE